MEGNVSHLFAKFNDLMESLLLGDGQKVKAVLD
jgi:hypothetical protein